MIPSDTFHQDETFFIVSKLLENSLEIATMELIYVKLEAEVCNFSRNKLHRKHFFRKVLKAETAFLFALFQSFWKTPLK